MEQAVTEHGQNEQLDGDDDDGRGERGVVVVDEEGQRVQRAADERSEPGDGAADDGIAAAGDCAYPIGPPRRPC
jgi:hypothetical protein